MLTFARIKMYAYLWCTYLNCTYIFTHIYNLLYSLAYKMAFIWLEIIWNVLNYFHRSGCIRTLKIVHFTRYICYNSATQLEGTGKSKNRYSSKNKQWNYGKMEKLCYFRNVSTAKRNVSCAMSTTKCSLWWRIKFFLLHSKKSPRAQMNILIKSLQVNNNFLLLCN